jgi:hypothetical protein
MKQIIEEALKKSATDLEAKMANLVNRNIYPEKDLDPSRRKKVVEDINTSEGSIAQGLQNYFRNHQEKAPESIEKKVLLDMLKSKSSVSLTDEQRNLFYKETHEKYKTKGWYTDLLNTMQRYSDFKDRFTSNEHTGDHNKTKKEYIDFVSNAIRTEEGYQQYMEKLLKEAFETGNKGKNY